MPAAVGKDLTSGQENQAQGQRPRESKHACHGIGLGGARGSSYPLPFGPPDPAGWMPKKEEGRLMAALWLAPQNRAARLRYALSRACYWPEL